ncbi:hypothetical protein GcM3_213036 [Golovinomyces cichoracearum]|uniref:Uncharacterized protein n=1 Tax=Golovinomyces cichoracearum TaxID=62708 RepID=A0A420H9D0_9PEZI|nr:hypothetical protein GcM3_213036 [Golovinomyces cichoracearum]
MTSKDGTEGYQELLDARMIENSYSTSDRQVIDVFKTSHIARNRCAEFNTSPVILKDNFAFTNYNSVDISFEIYMSTISNNNEILRLRQSIPMMNDMIMTD